MDSVIYLKYFWTVCLYFCLSNIVNCLYSLTSLTKNGTYMEPFTLVCSTSENIITWKQDMTDVAYLIGNTQCIPYHRYFPFYNFSCNVTQHVYMLTIPGTHMNDSLDKTQWACGQSKDLSKLMLYVNVPLQNLTLDVTTVAKKNNTVTILQNESTVLLCSTNSIRPTALLQWYVGDKDVSVLANQTFETAENGRFISSSFLNYTGKKDDNGKTIYCEGRNIVNTTFIKSNEMTLLIQYGPDVIDISPATFKYVVNATDDVNPITCKTKCSPNCAILWNGPNMFRLNDSVLNLTNVTRNQHGKYKCTAHNQFGNKTSETICIVVNYPPENMEILTNMSVVSENEPVQITCKYDSQPTSKIHWLFEKENFSLNDTNYVITTPSNEQTQTAVLTISKIGCLDMGNYTCSVSNALGSKAKTTEITVRCSPRITQNFTTKKIAISNSKPINITVPIVSYPEPKIEWRKNKMVLNISNEINITMTGQGNRYLTNLIIRNPSPNDFGSYEIYAGNRITNNTFLRSFEVVREGRPDPPKNLTCKTKQQNIKVSWISAFNGGKEQNFTVYFKKCLSPDSSYAPYYKPKSDPGNGKIISSEINGLTPATCYDFKVRAENVHNTTLSTGRATCNTTALKESKTEEETDSKLVPIVAGISGSIVLALVILIVYIVWKKKTANNKETVSTDENISSQRNNAFDDADGLKDNSCYVSTAEPMPKKERADVYTMVDKKRLKAHSTEMSNEDELRYNKDPERRYASSTRASHPNQNNERNSQRKNLVYAELDLDNSDGKRSFKIRGDEYRTDYADIDLERRASPEDSSDEEQQRGDSNKIKKTKF